jgi:hypothetical protein
MIMPPHSSSKPQGPFINVTSQIFFSFCCYFITVGVLNILWSLIFSLLNVLCLHTITVAFARTNNVQITSQRHICGRRFSVKQKRERLRSFPDYVNFFLLVYSHKFLKIDE